MADLVAVVSDTHPLLFYAARQRSLSRSALAHFQACERREVLIYIPAAVVWETCLLVRANRINLRRSAREFFGDLFSSPAFQPLELDNEHLDGQTSLYIYESTRSLLLLVLALIANYYSVVLRLERWESL